MNEAFNKDLKNGYSWLTKELEVKLLIKEHKVDEHL